MASIYDRDLSPMGRRPSIVLLPIAAAVRRLGYVLAAALLLAASFVLIEQLERIRDIERRRPLSLVGAAAAHTNPAIAAPRWAAVGSAGVPDVHPIFYVCETMRQGRQMLANGRKAARQRIEFKCEMVGGVR